MTIFIRWFLLVRSGPPLATWFRSAGLPPAESPSLDNLFKNHAARHGTAESNAFLAGSAHRSGISASPPATPRRLDLPPEATALWPV
jgi:hypothetical protein